MTDKTKKPAELSDTDVEKAGGGSKRGAGGSSKKPAHQN